MRPQDGDLISGKYRLLRLIGDGGMGSVYEARHEVLGTASRSSSCTPSWRGGQGLVERFLQEARVSASIQSPHVVHVTDVDQAGEGAAYLVMELLEGDSLQHACSSATGGWLAHGLRSTTRCRCWPGSRPRTRRASCTAISSRTTCSS